MIPGSSPNNTNAINGRDAGHDGYGDFRVNGKASNQTHVNLDGGSPSVMDMRRIEIGVRLRF